MEAIEEALQRIMRLDVVYLELCQAGIITEKEYYKRIQELSDYRDLKERERLQDRKGIFKMNMQKYE